MNQPRMHVSSHPEPPSHLPPHRIPLACLRAPALSARLHALNLHWSSVSHVVKHMFHAFLSNHPTLDFSHRVQKSIIYICGSFVALHIRLSLIPHICMLSKFHIYVFIYNIGVSLSDLLHSV